MRDECMTWAKGIVRDAAGEPGRPRGVHCLQLGHFEGMTGPCRRITQLRLELSVQRGELGQLRVRGRAGER